MLLLVIEGRSEDVFTGIAPDPKDALHVSLAERKGDDHVGCHDHVIRFTEEEIILQPYHHGETHPRHEENPAPAAHFQETQKDNDQSDGEDQIQQAFKNSLTMCCKDSIHEDRRGVNISENRFLDQRFNGLVNSDERIKQR